VSLQSLSDDRAAQRYKSSTPRIHFTLHTSTQYTNDLLYPDPMMQVMSFLIVAIGLLQMTVAVPVIERSEKKFACTSQHVCTICIMSNEMMHHGIDLIAEHSPVDERSERNLLVRLNKSVLSAPC